MKWRTSRSVEQETARVLPKMARKYFEAGEKLMVGRAGARSLHRFRIRTKKLRYTLELFRPVYGTDLDRKLKLLRQTQTHLGAISDAHTLLGLFEDEKDMAKTLRKRRKQKTQTFRRFWRKRVTAPDESTRWERELSSR